MRYYHNEVVRFAYWLEYLPQLIIFLVTNQGMKEKKDKDHEHFANDDPTEFEREKTKDLAKEAIKKFKSMNN